jgi:hypothetical protein
MTADNLPGFFFTEHQPLLWAIDQCSNRNLAIEVGTYYGGWTGVISAAYNHVITLQSMSDELLMPAYKKSMIPPTTHQTDTGTNLNISNQIERYRSRYDFNYMTDVVRDMKNVTPVLTESPPTIDWHWKFDLCTIDISRFPAENLKQYNYWKQHANSGAMMLIGVYTLRPTDDVVITLDQFMSSIDTHCEFVPGYDNYIYVKF